MTRRRGFLTKASLILWFVAGLTACGGGGGSSGSGSTASPPETPARELEIHAREITITPPANQAPEAVGTIPDQTLTEGGNARSVDVAPYFNDPNGDPLTWSARSGDPGVVTAGMSGSTLTLTPVSDGTATVTVTASDGNASALQTVSATVQGHQGSPTTQTTEEGQVEESSPPPPPQEPGVELTGINIQVRRASSRLANLTISPAPEGARLDHIILEADPPGEFRYYTKIGDSRYVGFNCSVGFTGDVTITISIPDGTIEASVTFACR